MKLALLVFTALLLFHSFVLKATKYEGTIKSSDGEVLPFASIFVKNTALGTNSNENGEFSISLSPGTYIIIFRYLGYETLQKTVTISEKDLTENIVLQPTTILLKEAVVGKGNEDPALAIMRKVVAMSEIHHKELASYRYKSYIKGNLKIIDIPFLLEKLAETSFIKKGQLYVFESVSQITFEQPNKLDQKVIAKKDNLPPTMKSAVRFEMGKFDMYNPESNYSPVTPKGVRNYNFEYLGYFTENGQIINKIKVTGKRRTGNIINNGILNIVDGSWYIHSYDYKYIEANGKEHYKVIFEKIQDSWLPTNYDNTSESETLGIKIAVRAVASVKDLTLQKNPRYASLKPIIVENEDIKNETVSTIRSTEKKQENKLTISDLGALKKQFEKADQRENNHKGFDDATSIRTYRVDSLASQRDSLYWNVERQVPLTVTEVEGFKKADSIYVANEVKIKEKLRKDSLDMAHPNRFKLPQLILGNTLKFKEVTDSLSTYYKNNLIIGSLLKDARFNAVEGYAIGIPGLKYQRNFSENDFFNIGVKTYYSFQRKQLNGDVRTEFKNRRLSGYAESGRRVYQINENQPIDAFLNAYAALVKGIHYGKFYENIYTMGGLNYDVTNKWQIGTSVRSSYRNSLENIISRGWKSDEDTFAPNAFIHSNGNSSTFTNNQLTVWNTSVTYSPRTSVSYYNGRKRVSNQQVTQFTLTNSTAFGKGKYNLLDFTAMHTQKIPFLTWKSTLNVGAFYGNKPLYVLDYKHFDGNLQTALTGDKFRNLDYYLYSSDKNYLAWFNEFQPKKLLLTQIPILAKNGIREYVFENTLLNPYIRHHEIGYGVQILTINVEVVGDFNNGKFNQTFFRLRAALPN